MSFLSSLPIIGKIFDKTITIIEKVIPDKDLQAKIKLFVPNLPVL